MTLGSVTRAIRKLQEGDAEGAERIWLEYFERLVTRCNYLASKRLRMEDGEDLASIVLHEFITKTSLEKHSQLYSRNHLWNLLVNIAHKRVSSAIRNENAKKRGGGENVQENVIAGGEDDRFRLDMEINSEEPSPELVQQLLETLENIATKLDDKMLLKIAMLQLMGYSPLEIAQQLNVSESTIRRKIGIIRTQLKEDWFD